MEQTVLSVRGEAQRTVSPDYATVHCGLRGAGPSKAEALALVREAQDAVTGALGELGGTALTVETRRGPLTWSVGHVNTYPVRRLDKATGRSRRTGRVRATASLLVVPRDLTLLDRVAQVLAQQARLHIGGVGWGVDDDNPEWRSVRADAIAAAIAKGRDYAVALGGAVRSVEHVADVGLLSADRAGAHMARASSEAVALGAGGSGRPRTPSLDPVPQQLQAVIEARLIADVPALEPDAE